MQNQLAAMGVNGVSVTGRLSGATRQGAEALRQQNPQAQGLAMLPRLTEKSAVGWCREIGALQPGLRKYMPAAQAPIVTGQGGAGSVQTALLRQSFQDVESFFKNHYGIYPASRVDVAGADSGEDLAQLAVGLQRQRGRSFGRMSTYVAKICETPSSKYGGQAYLDQLLICWPLKSRYDAAWAKKVRRVVGAIMAHEYMHHIQRELAHEKVLSKNYTPRRRFGPAWMVEGGAELGEYNWLVKRGYRKLTLQELQKSALKNSKGLRGMQNYGTVKGGEQYRTARFAVYLLAHRFGEDAVLNYWRYLGQGKSWEAAFRAAFGMSLGTYSSEFETLRRDLAQAKAFMAGK
ncbi:hypothetical protein [Leisingera sp. D0M16]|uniref:hypothetical protein n=1 Tax=Leisingera coralii TaxID=3351347 RepID=UPI003BA3CC3C